MLRLQPLRVIRSANPPGHSRRSGWGKYAAGAAEAGNAFHALGQKAADELITYRPNSTMHLCTIQHFRQAGVVYGIVLGAYPKVFSRRSHHPPQIAIFTVRIVLEQQYA